MTDLIIVTDEGEIKESSTKVTGPKGAANAYAQFAYGGNGQTKAEAMRLARDAVRQLKLEQKEYK